MILDPIPTGSTYEVYVDGKHGDIHIADAYEDCSGAFHDLLLDGHEARTLAARLLRAADEWDLQP